MYLHKRKEVKISKYKYTKKIMNKKKIKSKRKYYPTCEHEKSESVECLFWY